MHSLLHSARLHNAQMHIIFAQCFLVLHKRKAQSFKWLVSDILEVFRKYEMLILGLDNDDSDNPARRKKVLDLWFSVKDLNEAFQRGEKVELLLLDY